MVGAEVCETAEGSKVSDITGKLAAGPGRDELVSSGSEESRKVTLRDWRFLPWPVKPVSLTACAYPPKLLRRAGTCEQMGDKRNHSK